VQLHRAARNIVESLHFEAAAHGLRWTLIGRVNVLVWVPLEEEKKLKA
jgi:hypothetical protein